MQIKGKNYLVPVDCNITDEQLTSLSCFDMDGLFSGISDYKDNKTKIIILDSCRTNPFSSMLRGSMQSGFAPISNPPKGTIISFATSPDSTAADGAERNGLFTGVLKEHILTPNLKIEELFKIIRTQVMKLSGESQIPWEHSSLIGDFYFIYNPIESNKTISDLDIYNYVKERDKYYEQNNFDINDIECLAWVDAYKKFKKPIIEIVRSYMRISYAKHNKTHTDNDIDEINIGYLATWGFKYKHYRWYYKGEYVQMGDPLPISDELKEIPPIKGQEVQVEFKVSAILKDGLIHVISTTNLPNATPFIISLSSKEGDYSAQSKTEVKDGIISSEGFSNKGQTIKDGVYTISLTSPIYSVQPLHLKNIFGERNRNLIGQYIKYSPIGGNTVECSKILVKNTEKLLVF